MPLLPSHTLLQIYNFTLVGSSFLLLSNPLSLLNAAPLWLFGESMHIRRASFLPAMPGSGGSSTSAPGVTLHGSQSLASSILPGLGTSHHALPTSAREMLALLAFTLFLAGVSHIVLVTPLRYSKDVLVGLAEKSRSSKYGVHKDAGAVSEFAEKVHTLYTAQTLFLALAAVRVLFEGAMTAWIYLAYSERGHSVGGAMNTAERAAGEEGVMGLLANRIVFAVAMGDMLFWGYIWTVLREEARDVAEVVARRRLMEDEDRDR